MSPQPLRNIIQKTLNQQTLSFICAPSIHIKKSIYIVIKCTCYFRLDFTKEKDK